MWLGKRGTANGRNAYHHEIMGGRVAARVSNLQEAPSDLDETLAVGWRN
jgi:hypothetical protein